LSWFNVAYLHLFWRNSLLKCASQTEILKKITKTFILRAIAECFARLSHGLGVRPSVCLSVCLSVTLLYCVKMVQAMITKSSLWAAPNDSIVLNFVPLDEGVPLELGRQIGEPPTRRYFAAGSYSVKTVTDRYRLAAYHNKHW